MSYSSCSRRPRCSWLFSVIFSTSSGAWTYIIHHSHAYHIIDENIETKHGVMWCDVIRRYRSTASCSLGAISWTATWTCALPRCSCSSRTTSTIRCNSNSTCYTAVDTILHSGCCWARDRMGKQRVVWLVRPKVWWHGWHRLVWFCVECEIAVMSRDGTHCTE